MPTTTKTALAEAVRKALWETSLDRAFIRYVEQDCEGVESLLSDPCNADAIYAAAGNLRREMEALATLANDAENEEES